MSTTLIQVTNVSPSAGLQQMRELFSYFGDIEELRLFPEEEFAALSVPSKVCFINFMEEDSAAACLHLSNTVLIDRALIIARSRHAEIPDGSAAMFLAAPAIALANSASKPMGHTAPLLPTPPSMGAPAPTGPASMAMGAAMNPAALTAPLISMMGTVVPQPPPLTGNVDPTKIEEIRRTIYVGNLASNMTAEQVLTFFQPCGEIKYVRMAGDETQPTRFAFVEFAIPESVPIALQYNGAMFGERPINTSDLEAPYSGTHLVH
ncbi:serine/arginine-rich splicing factor 11-like isoform X3 [Halichondria panicea]|uniref:serine/arginine-rich splicing factor 11-like isoform X3 n=1 Tax=Halichondria panicea TaxID=6063 RepID=UPI00312BABD9